MRFEPFDPRLDSILAKAAAGDSALRYSSAEAMISDLRLYPSGESPAALAEKASADGRRSLRKTVLPALAAVALAAGSVAVFYHRVPAADLAPSIAVLPFADRAKEPKAQYLVDGIADRVRESLSRNRPLRVVAKSSSSRLSRGRWRCSREGFWAWSS